MGQTPLPSCYCKGCGVVASAPIIPPDGWWSLSKRDMRFAPVPWHKQGLYCSLPCLTKHTAERVAQGKIQ
jgi:hypothetical protein